MKIQQWLGIYEHRLDFQKIISQKAIHKFVLKLELKNI